MVKLYPVLFAPIIKTMIWGQESWDISCRPLEMGLVENGAYAGMRFDDYLALDRVQTLGTRLADVKRFPLLVKIIEARDVLSVQVHPDDSYAKLKQSTYSGKSEMWYILQPPTDGRLVIGLRDGVTREDLRRAYETGTVEDCLHYLTVHAGDMVNIPAGLVHALTPGAVIAEVQQNSDLTYRLYDYGRVGADGNPRELHVEDALAVTDFEGRIPREAASAVHCPFFSVERIVLGDAPNFPPIDGATNAGAFSILTCVDGAVNIIYTGGRVRLNTLQSVFLPAGLGAYTLEPMERATVLHSTIPA